MLTIDNGKFEVLFMVHANKYWLSSVWCCHQAPLGPPGILAKASRDGHNAYNIFKICSAVIASSLSYLPVSGLIVTSQEIMTRRKRLK